MTEPRKFNYRLRNCLSTFPSPACAKFDHLPEDVRVVLLLLWLTQGCILLQRELYANFQLPPPSANSLLGSYLIILPWLRMPLLILP